MSIQSSNESLSSHALLASQARHEPAVVPSAGTASPRGGCLLEAAVALVLAAVTFGVFAPVRNHDFVDYDDHLYVVGNANVKKGLTAEGLRWVWTAEVAANWHPLTLLSHMLDCHWFGLEAGHHHVTSVVWHTLNTVLLFWVLTRMTGQMWPSALVAGLFGWHPLHVESVAWIAERKDVLSTFFWFLTLAAYWFYVRRPSVLRYLAVATALALGLMSKPMLVTVPCVLLLLDWWPLGRFSTGLSGLADGPGPWSRRWRRAAWLVTEKVPLLVLVAVSSAVTIVVQRGAGAVQGFESNPLSKRLLNAGMAYFDYIGQTIRPAGLAVFYPHPMNLLDLRPEVLLYARIGCAVVILITLLIVLIFARRWPFVAVGWFWFLGTLVPVIGVIQVGAQARADRYTYVPLIGLFIIVAWSLSALARVGRGLRVASAVVAIAWLAALIPVTRQQVGHWENTVTLFAHALEVTRYNHVAHFGVGNGLVQRYDEQLKQGLTPDRATLEEAVEHYRKAVRFRGQDKVSLHALASTLQRLGRLDEAVTHYRAAIALGVEDASARLNLARCLKALNEPEAASRNFEAALQLEPHRVGPRMEWMGLLLQDGQLDRAIDVCQAGLEAQPNEPRLNDWLAWIYATHPDQRVRDPAGAIARAENACRVSGAKYPPFMVTLAAAYAEAGQFEAALEVATRALRQIRILEAEKPDVGWADVEKQLNQHIRLYQIRKPVREDPRDRSS